MKCCINSRWKCNLLGQDCSSKASPVFVLWRTDLAVFVPIASDGGAREGVVVVSDERVAD
jgi:hypothetical protein